MIRNVSKHILSWLCIFKIVLKMCNYTLNYRYGHRLDLSWIILSAVDFGSSQLRIMFSQKVNSKLVLKFYLMLTLMHNRIVQVSEVSLISDTKRFSFQEENWKKGNHLCKILLLWDIYFITLLLKRISNQVCNLFFW